MRDERFAAEIYGLFYISFEDGSISLTGYALPQKTPAYLTAALRAPPHLAVCLSACHSADGEKPSQKDDVWDDLDAYLDLGENEKEKDLSGSLVLADASMLDPACADAKSPLHMQLLMQKQAVLRNV